jgi:hypothetical protein
MLWLSTLSGEGTVSMASTANLATLAIWGPEASMWIVSASTLVAVLFVQKKPWVRAVFNASQSVITMWLGGLVFVLLGGPPGGLENAGQVLAGEGGAAALAAPVLALFATYLLVNRALVAVAVAWSTERAYLRVLREDWFYRERLLDDLASFLLSPLVVISYAAIGYVGVILFYAPLRMRATNRRSATSSCATPRTCSSTTSAWPPRAKWRPRSVTSCGTSWRRSAAGRRCCCATASARHSPRCRAMPRSSSSSRGAWRSCPRG